MKKTLRDYDFNNKTVLVRVDFNVPMSKTGDIEIKDDARIKAALPTIEYLIKNNAKVVLISHLGRPKGEYSPNLSLKPVATRLSELLNKEVQFFFSKDVVDANIENEIKELNYGEICLLENTRFRDGETKNDKKFAEELASLGDIFVNDAFGTSHRAHSSNVGIATILPSALGFLVEKEVEILSTTINNAEHPFISILGGAKISDKIGVIKNLITKVDTILIGGGMAYTFLKAQGKEIGKSLLEENKISFALELLQEAKERNVEIILPVDIVIAEKIDENAITEIVDVDNIPSDMEGLDIGPITSKIFGDKIAKGKTVIWNGPMGVFEVKPFSSGTLSIAIAIAKCEGKTIVGGGDSALAIEMSGLNDSITHVSTGGGASLELLEGKSLPGIDSISDK